MNTNEFDNIVRSRFEEWEVPYEEGAWRSLHHELKEPLVIHKKEFNKKWIASAAAFLIFGFVWAAILYSYMNKQSNTIIEGASTVQVKNNVPNTVAINAAPAVPTNQPISSLSTNFPVANAYSKYLNKPFTVPGQRGMVIMTNNESGEEISLDKAIELVQQPQATVVVKHNETTAPSLKNNKSANTLPMVLLPGGNAYDGSNFHNNGKGFEMGIVGAVGYGGITSSGYSVGVNTRNNLNKRIYIDNTLAFGSSQELYNVTAFQNLGSHGNFASKNVSPQKELNLKGNLYFVTLAPTFGINITKKISLGGGGDVQRIVRNDIKTPEDFFTGFVADENGTAVTSQPVKWKSWDAGLTARANIKLTKKLDVGVQYRQGMVNLLSEQQGMSLKRSYGTISLQYRILGNDK